MSMQLYEIKSFKDIIFPVKSTTQIVSGKDSEEYSSTQVLQMIGRAGRPQFDIEATAIIMTQSSLRVRFKIKHLHRFTAMFLFLRIITKEFFVALILLKVASIYRSKST